ncbi:hypothetical protein H310_09777 [Aphanomyces invadans]|uniref:Uncharacterized protein n=1 Tax=Aphanomyces invadans TaxID=157072 RepID=A0A024TUD8_9STRA|nr:hypothetical protein H310_09777 [Aphanomyces invadans]ETV96912.1 hypothetical protein H310_09777 [Aphanomyces invadans]|eukprot:XP_008874158.1 hypothetical protein H310_09777 [Aphanomyces invadans]
MTILLNQRNSPLDDDRVLCVFHAVQVPTCLFSKLNNYFSQPTKLTVFISAGIVKIEHNIYATEIVAADLGIVQRNEHSVFLHEPAHKTTLQFDFPSPLEALHFVGTVDLLQYIHALRGPQMDAASCTLEHHMRQTLDYAEMLWELDLWRRSASYYSILETLSYALQELHCDDVHFGAIQKMLGALCDKFECDASFDQIIHVDGQDFHCITPLSVLLAKITALFTHVSSF